jgi:class 3 adenylate cyclase
MVEYWRSHDLEPEVIDITNLTQNADTTPKTPVSSGPLTPTGGILAENFSSFTQEIRAMLFADVVGYGKLLDEKIPSFVTNFMGLIAELVDTSSSKPLTKNTWGDALYFVFSSAKDAGSFALNLRDRICGTDWKKKGLPGDLNLRISLHAGPVYFCEDPVLKVRKYTGSHVSRAARIEAITPPGEVYASLQFAALAAAQRVRDFDLDYVGQVPLPKESGIVPLYLVRPSNP